MAEINHCNKCGFCLPVCPTYRLTGNELDSPRGRIAMVEGMLLDEIEAGDGLEASLSYCLGCRACETACPSGVEFHLIAQAGKEVLDKTRPKHRRITLLPRTLLRMTTNPARMARMARWGRRAAHLPLPGRLKQLVPMLDYVPETVVPAPAPTEYLGEAAFFQGCVQEALFQDANQSAVELLSAVGYQVVSPPSQTCCGALAWHAGRSDEARALARANIAAFEQSGETPVVNTAGGCGAMLSEYDEVLADDPEWAERARRFSQRVRDWTGLLKDMEKPPRFVGTGERIALQNSCHLVNVEGGGEVPAQLLGNVEGDTFVPLTGQDQCCGSAGIYNIQHPDWSMRILDSKMTEVEDENPARMLVVNPGCQLQMTLGMKRCHLDGQVEHLARYLYHAYLRGQEQSARA